MDAEETREIHLILGRQLEIRAQLRAKMSSGVIGVEQIPAEQPRRDGPLSTCGLKNGVGDPCGIPAL